MIKKIIGIFVCFLFFGAGVLPIITGFEKDVEKNEINDYYKLINLVNENGILSNKGWLEQDKLLASDGEEEDFFGHSVSVSGDYAIIGVPYDDDNGEYSGSAYIFKSSGTEWIQQAKLLASDGAVGDWFGYSVFLDEDTALIGAYMDDNPIEDAGSAYVFIRNGATWIQQAKLIASDAEYLDAFGASVSISGNTALIGAPGEGDTGSAYVFIRSDTIWTQQAKLLALDGETGDRLGWSVFIDDDTAIMGVCEDDDLGVDSGSAYVFIRTGTTWTQQAKLLASDGAAGDLFGYSVSLDDDTALIGAPYDNDTIEYSGSAYIFVRNNSIWTQQAKLLASAPVIWAGFGWSVSIYNDYAAIGAIGELSASGAAYIFKRSGTNWIQEEKLTASDSHDADWFGQSVSILGDIVFIGACADDDNGEDSGSVYVFNKETGNKPPSAPTITGTTKGKPGISYPYTFTSIDPDGDDISYYIRWGDGDIIDWTDFQASGPPGYGESHSWEQGTFNIQAQAKDNYGYKSDWAEYTVKMPRIKSINIPFQWLQNLLKNHPNLFPIIRQLLRLN